MIKCTACGWNNPGSYTRCFNCERPFRTDAPAAPAPSQPKTKSPAANTRKPAPATLALGSVAEDAVIAGKLARFAALGVDIVMVAAVLVPASIVYMLFGLHDASTQLSWTIVAVAFALGMFFLPAWMDSFTAGSLGKRLLNLRVINQQGQRPGVLRSMLRHVLKFALHAIAPIILLIVEKVLLRGSSTHDVLMSTRVIDRRATEAQIQRVLAEGPAGGAIGSLVRGLVVFAGMAVVLAVGLFAWSMYTAKPNPTRDAIVALSGVAKGLGVQSENYFYAKSAFPSSLADLGLKRPPDGFSDARFNASNGSVVLTIGQHSNNALVGKQLIIYPQFKKKKGEDSIYKWRCGSPDIPRDDLPYVCHENVAAFN